MKKGFTTTELVVSLIVAIIVGLLILGGLYGGLFRRATEGSIAENFFSDMEEQKGDEKIELPQIPPLHRESINLLKSTIERMLKSPKNRCFANYGGFPDLIEGTTLEMNFDPNTRSTEFSVGTFGGEQYVSSFKIKDMVPCVIAGSSIPENFEESFLNDKPWSEKNILPNHYNSVAKIRISYEDPTVGFAGNVIRVPDLGKDIVNDESNNFIDGGYIYKPEAGVICFFPTVFGSSDNDGLDDNYLGQSPVETDGIAYQLGENKLVQC